MRRRDLMAALVSAPLLSWTARGAEPAAALANANPAKKSNDYETAFICPKYAYAFYPTYWSYYAIRYNGACGNATAVTFDGPPMTTPVNCTLPNCPCIQIEVYDAKKARKKDGAAVEIYSKNVPNGQLAHYADPSVIDAGLAMDANAPVLSTFGETVVKRWFTLELESEKRKIQIFEFQTTSVASHPGGNWVHVAFDLGDAAPQGNEYSPNKIKTKTKKGDQSYVVRIDQTGGSGADRDYHVYLRH